MTSSFDQQYEFETQSLSVKGGCFGVGKYSGF